MSGMELEPESDVEIQDFTKAEELAHQVETKLTIYDVYEQRKLNSQQLNRPESAEINAFKAEILSVQGVSLDDKLEVVGTATNVNEQDDQKHVGYTPLIRAILKKSAPLIFHLVEKEGINLDLQDNQNKRTALIWSILEQQFDTAELLIKRGAKLEIRTIYKYTALMVLAFMHDNPASALVFDALMKNNADLTVVNNNGENPLDVAIKYGNLTFCSKFMEAVEIRGSAAFKQQYGKNLNALGLISKSSASLAVQYLLSPAMALERMEDPDIDFRFKFRLLRNHVRLIGSDEPYVKENGIWVRLFKKNATHQVRRSSISYVSRDIGDTATEAPTTTLYSIVNGFNYWLKGLVTDMVDVDARAFQTPMEDMASLQALHLYMHIANETQDFSIFGTESVSTAVDFAWQIYGFPSHMRSLALYLLLLAITSYANFSFAHLMLVNSQSSYITGLTVVAAALLVASFLMSIELIRFINAANKPLHYLASTTSYIHVIALLFTITGSAMRLYYSAEDYTTSALLAIASILHWVNLLYFMRPFQSASAITRMLYVDAQYELRSFALVMLFFMYGFSQAMYLLALEDSSSPFAGGSGDSYLVAFSYMLGATNFAVFNDTSNPSLGIAVVVLFLCVMTIIALNLLIAILSRSYDIIQNDMAVGFRVEKVRVMLDQLHVSDPMVMKYVYCLKRLDDVNADQRAKSFDAKVDSLRDDFRNLMDKQTKMDFDIQELKEMINTLLHSLDKSSTS